MEHKKDIGTLFEEKLQNKEANPKKGLWKKVNTVLDQRATKRKRLYWYGGIATGIVLIAILAFSINFIEKNEKTPKQSSPLASPISNKLKTSENNKISKVDSVEKQLPKPVVDSISNKYEKPQETVSVSSVKNIKKTTSAEKETDSFKKKTFYYYYNSQDSTMMKTTNKSIIDSLLKENNSGKK